MDSEFKGDERRQFLRLPYKTPLPYKVCKKETISKMLQGYTQNISLAGLMCNIKEKVPLKSTVWLGLDIGTLNICEDLEKRCIIQQKGILGKVVWADKKKNGSYDVGLRFLTREEKTEMSLPLIR